ncbi:hypothetical protein GCM10029963_53300 [Micromonospora andamanensis]
MDAPVTPDEETAPRRTPAQRIAAAAGDAWRGLVDVFGVFDWITVLGVAMLLAGLWVWFGTGPALAGVGALVVWMGIAGGRAAPGRPPATSTRTRPSSSLAATSSARRCSGWAAD